MILQIFHNNKLIKDLLCMKHEHDGFIASLELSRIPYKVISDRLIDGLQHVSITAENTSLVNKYFY